MTRSELLDRVSSAELTEWMAVWKIRAQEAKDAKSQRPPVSRMGR